MGEIWLDLKRFAELHDSVVWSMSKGIGESQVNFTDET